MGKKDSFLARLREERERFMEAFTGLSEEEMTERPAIGTWSVKDTIGHVARSEKEALKKLQALRRHKPLPPSDDDFNKINAAVWQEIKDLPFEKIQAEFRSVHRRLLRELERWSERSDIKGAPSWDPQGGGGFGWLVTHYDEHGRSILDWRQRKIKGE